MRGPGCLCALGQLLLPPHRLSLQGGDTQSGQQSPEMLQARLSPPFISPVSLSTASGEGRQQGWLCPDCPGKDLFPTGSQRVTCPHSCKCLFLKSSLLQPGSWPFLLPSSPHSSGLCSPIPCSCIALSFTRSLQLVARALEQQSQDALLASIFIVLCKDSNWGLC